MKKLGFPLFLLRTNLVPMLTFDLADKRRAITDPPKTESKFIYFIGRKVLANLSPPQKNLLITYLKENSPHLGNSSKYLFFREYKSSFFGSYFYKEIHQNEEWYKYSLGILSNGKYHTFPEVVEC